MCGIPIKNMKSNGTQVIEACMPFWLRNGLRPWGFKGEEGKSQEDEKRRCLVLRCLPCQRDKKLSLVIALFLSGPYLNPFRQWREIKGFLESAGRGCLQFKITHMPKWHILGRTILHTLPLNTSEFISQWQGHSLTQPQYSYQWQET